MKRQMVSVMVAVVLLWGGTAFAQGFGAKMDGGASNECASGVEPVSMFPYFASSDGNWINGIYLVNTSGTEIPADALCVVGVDAAGAELGFWYDEPLKGDGGSDILVKNNFGTDWNKELYLGIYAKNAEVAEAAQSLVAFGSISNRGQGGAYGTSFVNHEPGTKLKFDFLPGGGNWWGGMVFWNTAATPATLTFTYYKNEIKTVAPETIEVPANGFKKLQAADLTWWDANVTVEVDSNQPVYGYAQYGNGRSTNAYFPQYIDE